MPVIVHPDVPPRDAVSELITVQNKLLSTAEVLLGTRDRTYNILVPRFSGEGRPRIYYVSKEKAAYIIPFHPDVRVKELVEV